MSIFFAVSFFICTFVGELHALSVGRRPFRGNINNSISSYSVNLGT